MSKQFNSLMKGLNEILEYTKGDTSKCVVRKAKLEVKPLKEYTQE